MKATWLEVANNDKFSIEMEEKLKSEENQLTILQEQVYAFLMPYEDAKEFLSWTLTQMTHVKEEGGRYPEAGYDDIVLEEYLKGAVMIMNLDKWIPENPENNIFQSQEEERTKSSSENKTKEKRIDVDLEKRRVLAFRDYCKTNDVPFQRIIVKSTIECSHSITNDGFITFRKNIPLN